MKKQNKQIELPNLGAPKFKGAEDYLHQRGKDESTTPLFQQSAEDDAQLDLFNPKKCKCKPGQLCPICSDIPLI